MRESKVLPHAHSAKLASVWCSVQWPCTALVIFQMLWDPFHKFLWIERKRVSYFHVNCYFSFIEYNSCACTWLVYKSQCNSLLVREFVVGLDLFPAKKKCTTAFLRNYGIHLSYINWTRSTLSRGCECKDFVWIATERVSVWRKLEMPLHQIWTLWSPLRSYPFFLYFIISLSTIIIFHFMFLFWIK